MGVGTDSHVGTGPRGELRQLEYSQRLVARQRAAQAREQMDRVSDRFQTGLDLDHSFGRMTDKVGEMEARMEARAELYGEYSEIEREFLKMETNSEVEAELAALRKELKG